MPAPKFLTRFLPPAAPPFAEEIAAAEARMETANIARLALAGDVEAARAALDAAYEAEAKRAVIRELKEKLEDAEDSVRVADAAIKNARADLFAWREKQQDALAFVQREVVLDVGEELLPHLIGVLELGERYLREMEKFRQFPSANCPRPPALNIPGLFNFFGTVADRYKPLPVARNFIRNMERLKIERQKAKARAA